MKRKANLHIQRGLGLQQTVPDLIRAIRLHKIDEVREILKHTPEAIFQVDDVRMNGLHWSGGLGNYEISEVLFAAPGVERIKEAQDWVGREPMQLALESGDEDVKELFFKNIFPEVYENPDNPYGKDDGASKKGKGKRGNRNPKPSGP